MFPGGTGITWQAFAILEEMVTSGTCLGTEANMQGENEFNWNLRSLFATTGAPLWQTLPPENI